MRKETATRSWRGGNAVKGSGKAVEGKLLRKRDCKLEKDNTRYCSAALSTHVGHELGRSRCGSPSGTKEMTCG